MQCALTTPPPGLLGVVPTVPGVDFGWSGVSAATAKASGFKFGASYLSSDGSKNWTPRLIASYHADGLATVNVWETSSTRTLDGFSAGQADARVALGQSLALGSGYRPIYFAIDFDETAAQSVAVAQYFRGVHSVLDNAGPVSFPHPVSVGAYGGYWAVKRLFDAHLITYAWQTYAWSGGLWDSRAQIHQYLNGSAFDYDRAVAVDYGQTPFATPKPPKPVDLHDYLRFVTKPVKERQAVERYDGAIQHSKYNAYRQNVLEPKLLLLAHRLVWLATHVHGTVHHPNYKWDDAGGRTQELLHRAQGRSCSTWSVCL